jgi:hypothetical protein
MDNPTFLFLYEFILGGFLNTHLKDLFCTKLRNAFGASTGASIRQFLAVTEHTAKKRALPLPTTSDTSKKSRTSASHDPLLGQFHPGSDAADQVGDASRRRVPTTPIPAEASAMEIDTGHFQDTIECPINTPTLPIAVEVSVTAIVDYLDGNYSGGGAAEGSLIDKVVDIEDDFEDVTALFVSCGLVDPTIGAQQAQVGGSESTKETDSSHAVSI